MQSVPDIARRTVGEKSAYLFSGEKKEIRGKQTYEVDIEGGEKRMGWHGCAAGSIDWIG